jgi:GTPase SAR1 family protein
VSYFKGAHGVLLVYDVTDRATFDSIRHWLQQLKMHASSSIDKILLANKMDKTEARMVSKAEGEALAAEAGIKFFETSAKGDVNVSEAFGFLAKEVKQRMMRGGEERASEGAGATDTVKLVGSKRSKGNGCC